VELEVKEAGNDSVYLSVSRYAPVTSCCKLIYETSVSQRMVNFLTLVV
jgi:hypothetical protein